MKKFLITAVALLTATVFQASAMSTARARAEALFLTDKMAYELNLTDDQYEAVYEINFDYFASLVGTSDILGIYWNRRANELGYVLTSWQWRRFMESEYFYRPVVVRNSAIHFAIYDHYAHGRFFRPAPKVYANYRGNRNYHSAPHNGKHFADNHIGKKPVAGNNAAGARPSTGKNANTGKAARPDGGSNANMGGGKTGKAGSAALDRPSGDTGSGAAKVAKTTTGSKPASVGSGSGSDTRRASKNAPVRSGNNGSTITRAPGGSASSSSAGRRR